MLSPKPVSVLRSSSLIFIFASLLPLSYAHSFLNYPRPYNSRYNPGFYPDGCKMEHGQNQCLACPPIRSPKDDNMNSEDQPEVTWARNERTTISWARNNHAGGFVRFSFVPVKDMFNKTVQSNTAFYYGCFENNQKECKTRGGCGSDRKDRFFRVTLSVPDNLPDGVYVFSFAWYGGLRFDISSGFYADYYSCSFVRIRGGGPVADEYEPYFNRGWKALHLDPKGFGRCVTAFAEPGHCLQRRECTTTEPYYIVPKPFQFGNKPQNIPSSLYA